MILSVLLNSAFNLQNFMLYKIDVYIYKWQEQTSMRKLLLTLNQLCYITLTLYHSFHQGKNLQDKLREQIFVTVGRLTCKITSVDKVHYFIRFLFPYVLLQDLCLFILSVLLSRYHTLYSTKFKVKIVQLHGNIKWNHFELVNCVHAQE